MIIPLVVMLFFIILYVVLFKIPLKKTIGSNDLSQYKNIIIVQGRTGPPTDWLQIGDYNGLYTEKDQFMSVCLDGSEPAQNYGMEFDLAVNEYVCFVQYQGEKPFLDQGLVKTYTVLDWAPFGPIHRGGVLSWLAPEGYTCLWDTLF